MYLVCTEISVIIVLTIQEIKKEAGSVVIPIECLLLAGLQWAVPLPHYSYHLYGTQQLQGLPLAERYQTLTSY